MAAMEPRAFLEDVIINGFHPREIVVGYDTHFGRHRQGNFPFLQSHEADYGYTTRFVEPVMVEDVIVSSSRIRDFVRQGAVDRVPALMGRPYSMLGKVESGAHIGHKLGFPTINLRPLDPHKLLPANGVYVSCARVDGADYVSVTNVGYSPTVKSEHPLEVETHLLDFSGDLYGHEVELVFTERIRDEVRFHNRATLSEAIAADVRFARSRYHA
jgi:riboflavin kinase/FMN adenylyltransferase